MITLEISYLEGGKGEPLVLLHANPGDSRDFEAVIPALAQRYRVIAVDWPGYGKSAMPGAPEQTTPLTFYEALRDLIARLALPPAIFIGNSVGGNAAARLASEAPELVRALVLVAPGGFTPHNFLSRGFCKLQGSSFSLSPYRFASLYLEVRSPTAKAMLDRARGEQATPERIALGRALWRSFGGPDNDLREAAKRIKAPTLLLFGKYDPAISPGKDGRVAAATIAGSKMVTLPCGHASFAEVPEMFLKEVLPFLEGINGV